MFLVLFTNTERAVPKKGNPHTKTNVSYRNVVFLYVCLQVQSEQREKKKDNRNGRTQYKKRKGNL